MAARLTPAQFAALGRPRPAKRPRKPQRGEEAALMRQAQQLLTARGVFWMRLNAGSVRIGGRLVRLAPAGCSDLLLVLGGRAVFCELKAAAGRQRPSQKAFEAAARAAGAAYHVARSVADVERILSEEGAR